MIRLGSRGMISSIGCVRLARMEISSPLEWSTVNEIDRDRLVIKFEDD